MREPPQGTRTSPLNRDHEACATDSSCRRTGVRDAAVGHDLVVASDYALPESTLSLLAGLVVNLAAKGAKTEAA